MNPFVRLALAATVIILAATAAAEETPKSAANTDVDAYARYLDSLPKNEPGSIDKAIGEYLKTITPLSVEVRTEAFLVFLDFHDAACKAVRDASTLNTENMGDDKVEKSPENRELRCHGLELYSDGEGGYWVRGVPDYIPRVLGPHVALSVKRYLELRIDELKEGYAGDGELVMGPQRLAERLAQWGPYLKDFPQSRLAADVRLLCKLYTENLMRGEENSPFFDEPDGEKTMRSVYDSFLAKYGDTESGRIIAEHYRWLDKHGWKGSQELYEHVRDDYPDLWKEMFRAWPAVQLYFRVVDRKG